MAVYDPLRSSAATMDAITATRTPASDLARRQQQRLDRLWQAAGKSRYYRKLYRSHGIDPDGPMPPLASLPPVHKGKLMAHFNDWVTDDRLTLHKARAHVADRCCIAQALEGRYLLWESSGTSGEPGIFVQDAATLAVYDALEAVRRDQPQTLQRWMDPWHLNERIAFVGALGGHFASHVSMLRLQEHNPVMAQGLRCFSILDPVHELVAALDAFQPTVIATYPTAATMLADETRRGHLHAVPREVWTGGETLSPAARQMITDTWHCSLRNSYGASEFLAMGWECGHGRLHLNADWVILEPVDEHQRPVPPGTTGASTLLTNLANMVQPLIRYDLGDQVRYTGEACPCGCTLPVIEVQGRRDDLLVMAGRGGHPVMLLPLALSTVLEDEAGVFDFHLRQQDDRTLALRVGGTRDEARDALHRGASALKAFAKRQGVVALHVVTEPDQPVPRGRSGKAQRIVARSA